MKGQTYCYEGCVDLVGAMIAEAVFDYVVTYKNLNKYIDKINKYKNRKRRAQKETNILNRARARVNDFHSAESFIFKGGLKAWCEIFFPNVSYSYIQSVCKKYIDTPEVLKDPSDLFLKSVIKVQEMEGGEHEPIETRQF